TTCLSDTCWKESESQKSHSLTMPPCLSVSTSSRLEIILSSSPVAPGNERSQWSSRHCSPHFQLSACKEEATRSPVEQSSDGLRAETGVSSGLHVWEVQWNPNHRGSHAVIGISTMHCPLQASGYNVLVGGDSQSWGWELKTNQLWHDGQSVGLYPQKRRCHSEAPEDFRIQSLHFLGVAFKDLPCGMELFPAVSSVRGGASIRSDGFVWTFYPSVLGQQRLNQTDKLPLPPFLQRHLLSSL
uniref:Si:ch1073-228j22.2 n=1 Tax=Sphaeramia orbicularis TaxID=375764 RepID=A0A673ASR2_9TELE